MKYAKLRAVAAVVIGAAAAGAVVVAWTDGSGVRTWALALAGAAALLAVPAYLHLRLYARVLEADRQQRALAAVRPLAGPLPLRFGGWAIDPSTAELLVQLLSRERPALVLELGSGASTVVMAAALRELGGGRIVSVEHEERFAAATRRLLRERGLEAWAEVWAAPLEERRVDGREVRWYGRFEDRLPGPVELLFVDGPPKRAARAARSPAVPVLADRLAPGCLVVLDDGGRPAERRMARRWAKRLSGSLEYVPGGRGVWLIRRAAAGRGA